MNLIATPIVALRDNYIWLLEGGGERWVVDPGEAQPVLNHLGDERLSGILITHHHGDHVGGVDALRRHYADDLPVLGPTDSPFKGASKELRDGDAPMVCGLPAQVLAVPGHTLDHIAYLLSPAGATPMLLCGDTLFAAGCGRVFEGSAAQMHHSLMKLAALPAATRLYCAHEYTVSNLHFAALVEPASAAIKERLQECARLRGAGRPTLPSTMELELASNPFLRTAEPAVIASAERRAGHALESADAVFAVLRGWKDCA